MLHIQIHGEGNKIEKKGRVKDKGTKGDSKGGRERDMKGENEGEGIVKRQFNKLIFI